MKFTVYRIASINPELTQCYIGSTKNIKNRTIMHHSDCNNVNSPRYNYPMYQYIRNNGGMLNFEFINLRDIDIDGDDKKAIYEQYYFEMYGGFTNCLNKYYPNRSKLQYRIQHEVEIKQYRTDNKESIKQYRENNKEKMKQYQIIYRNMNKIK